jgi:hypothetical protein
MTAIRARFAMPTVLVTLGVWPALPAVAAPQQSPALRYPVGSAGMTTAIAVAERYWNASPCDGDVALTWRPYTPVTEDARAYWTNPLAFYGAPELNTNCAIVFNSRALLPWSRFCTVVVHEYGHLTGHPHRDDPLDVMAPTKRLTLPACAAIPDPAVPRQRRSAT